MAEDSVLALRGVSKSFRTFAGANVVLRDVTLTLEPDEAGTLRFEGDALGGTFERLRLAGTLDPESGRVEFSSGDLTGLSISESLRHHLPRELGPMLASIISAGRSASGRTKASARKFSRSGRRILPSSRSARMSW